MKLEDMENWVTIHTPKIAIILFCLWVAIDLVGLFIDTRAIGRLQPVIALIFLPLAIAWCLAA